MEKKVLKVVKFINENFCMIFSKSSSSKDSFVLTSAIISDSRSWRNSGSLHITLSFIEAAPSRTVSSHCSLLRNFWRSDLYSLSYEFLLNFPGTELWTKNNHIAVPDTIYHKPCIEIMQNQ